MKIYCASWCNKNGGGKMYCALYGLFSRTKNLYRQTNWKTYLKLLHVPVFCAIWALLNMSLKGFLTMVKAINDGVANGIFPPDTGGDKRNMIMRVLQVSN